MRIALFITCFNDTMFPGTGRAVTTLLERLGHTVEFPPGRPAAARCTSTPATAPRPCRWCAVSPRPSRATTPSSRPPASCVGMVRDHYRVVAAAVAATPASPRRSSRWWRRCTSCRNSWSTCSASPTWARTSRTASPTIRPATRCACSASATGRCRLLRAVEGIDLVELPDADVLRLRRHLRGQERRRVQRHAGRQDAPRAETGAEVLCAADNSCLMHIGGGLSPAAGRASARCTWPRSCRPRKGTSR